MSTFRGRHFLLVASAGFVLLVLAQAARADTPFAYDIVDDSPGVGTYCSLALDALGHPHISYYDETNGDLKYAWWSGSRWSIETVDDAGDVGTHTSLALDAQSNPHISYHDETNLDLKYATWTGNSWLIETVDSPGNPGQYTSIALDPDGNPCISYYGATGMDLKFASKQDGAWTIEVADSEDDVGLYTSLAIDTAGEKHISYYDATNEDLRYIRTEAGSWLNSDTVDSSYDVGWFTSIALDSAGRPRICYLFHGDPDNPGGYTDDEIRYAQYDTRGGWTIETAVASTGEGGKTRGSLALDQEGAPRIFYYDDNQEHLGYAAKVDGAWVLEDLDVFVQPEYVSLVLDAQDVPRAAYSTRNGELRYADAAVHLLSPLGGERWAAGSQQEIRWRGGGSVSIQLSDDGGRSYSTVLESVSRNDMSITVPALQSDEARVRIVRSSPYSSSESPGYFMVAPGLASPWWTRTVESIGDVGRYCSLALGSEGTPRISYSDETNQVLRYASKVGGEWVTETADSEVGSGHFTSLAVDVGDEPHIAYVHEDDGKLKYATKSDGSWTVETVDASGDVNGYTSLALDAAGRPHVGYYDGSLEYVSRIGGIWGAPETVDPDGIDPSLALDIEDEPHIAYLDGAADDLLYASKSVGVWIPEIVDGAVGPLSQASLALDSEGNPHIGYYDGGDQDLKYATRTDGIWRLETVDETGNVGRYPSLALDNRGEPRIAYLDLSNETIKLASHASGRWILETVADAASFPVGGLSVALDAQSTPRFAYFDRDVADLRYASGAIELRDPEPGATWPVGAPRTVTWDGNGRVNLYLSVDGGRTWDLLARDLAGTSYRLEVPHAPTRFGRLKLERSVPQSIAVTPGLFSIEGSVELLSFRIEPGTEGGARLRWHSRPDLEDLAGYRIERKGGETSWVTLIPLLRDTGFDDPDGLPGSRYRLFAVNRLGEELVLGEATLPPARPIAAWPLPYRDGELIVSFAVGGLIGDVGGHAEVALCDVNGRQVRVLAHGYYSGARQTVTWNGLDANGDPVAAGIYFLRWVSGGNRQALKVAVLR